MRTILKAAAAANPINVTITIQATAQPLHSHFFPHPQIARMLFLGTKLAYEMSRNWPEFFCREIRRFLGTNWPIISMGQPIFGTNPPILGTNLVDFEYEVGWF